MPTNSFPIICHRFDLKDCDGEIIIRWDINVVRDDEGDWIEVYKAKYKYNGDIYEVKRELILSESLGEAIKLFEKTLGFLKGFTDSWLQTRLRSGHLYGAWCIVKGEMGDESDEE